MADALDRTRRRLLQGSAALAPAALLGADLAGAQVATPGSPDLGSGAPQEGHVTHPGYRPAFFDAAEWAFVCAAVDRLIPRDEHGPGALELGVAEYIDRQMQTPWAEGARWYMQGPFIKAAPEFGYQSKLVPREQYRINLRAADAWCRKIYGHVFADLPVADRDAALKAMEDGKAGEDAPALKTFFTSFLLKNTLEGYWGDPMYGGNKNMAAWKMIGYPGVRADYQDWVTRAGPYPYGPVSLHGREA